MFRPRMAGPQSVTQTGRKEHSFRPVFNRFFLPENNLYSGIRAREMLQYKSAVIWTAAETAACGHQGMMDRRIRPGSGIRTARAYRMKEGL